MAWMGTIEGDLADPPSCTLLGLAADPRTHFTYPHPAHRCFATKQPATTDLRRQQAFCLSSAFVDCDRYLAWRSAIASRTVGPGRRSRREPRRARPSPRPCR